MPGVAEHEAALPDMTVGGVAPTGRQARRHAQRGAAGSPRQGDRRIVRRAGRRHGVCQPAPAVAVAVSALDRVGLLARVDPDRRRTRAGAAAHVGYPVGDLEACEELDLSRPDSSRPCSTRRARPRRIGEDTVLPVAIVAASGGWCSGCGCYGPTCWTPPPPRGSPATTSAALSADRRRPRRRACAAEPAVR